MELDCEAPMNTTTKQKQSMTRIEELKELVNEIANIETAASHHSDRSNSAHEYIEALGKRLGIEHGDWVTLIKGIDDKLTQLGFPQTPM
jgi:hypothetical protein